MSAPNALPPPQLVASGLTLRRGERLLFEGLSLAVEQHQALLLRGPNGAGKTTLLLALAGIVRPDAGGIEYRIEGVSTPRMALLHLVGHRPALKPRLTVAENLAFWKAVNGGTGLAVEAALQRVGLAALAGLDAGYLSAGQTRRLALARLLVSERPIWLLDEPTASLDAEGEALVGELIAGHCRGPGLALVATHHELVGVSNAMTLTLGGVA